MTRQLCRRLRSQVTLLAKLFRWLIVTVINLWVLYLRPIFFRPIWQRKRVSVILSMARRISRIRRSLAIKKLEMFKREYQLRFESAGRHGTCSRYVLYLTGRHYAQILVTGWHAQQENFRMSLLMEPAVDCKCGHAAYW